MAEEKQGFEGSLWVLDCCGFLWVLALEKLDYESLSTEGLQIFSCFPEQGKY